MDVPDSVLHASTQIRAVSKNSLVSVILVGTSLEDK